MQFEDSLDFAKTQDQNDPLSKFRDQYIFPTNSTYLCGHSLGLQHKSTSDFITAELQKWATKGVEGHFSKDKPWLNYHEFLTPHLAKLTGAKEPEVVATNSLTTNLHLLMVSFYTPSEKRYKIAIEKGAFPSDRYAVLSQLKYHGYDEHDLIEIQGSNPGYISKEDFNQFFDQHGKETALILIGGVNYLSGQFFPIDYLSEKCMENNITFGIDLAHAMGNLPLELHKWNVDFAAWCSYKYLNGGPGTVGGIFVHEKHHAVELTRFEGWWGNKVDNRFLMKPEFEAYESAEAWQLSNAPIMSMASLLPSLESFSEAGIDRLREKSIHLTAYLEYLLEKRFKNDLTIVTTQNKDERGAQLSFVLKGVTKKLVDHLASKGVYFDWRESDHGGLIRVAPVPMYNNYEDVFHFVHSLKTALNES